MADFLRLENLTKIFKDLDSGKESMAVDRFSLNINRGEWLSLVGPSGCGKTTLLRMIAGLETPTAGKILLKGQDLTSVPAHIRKFAMVFQTPSLFPHLTLEENIAYGLRLRKFPTVEIHSRVSEMIQMIQLEGFEKRFPNELSGGQQQRGALARALIVQPELLLLDEAFANLDADLRHALRSQTREIQKILQITCLLVTHDEAEAKTLSDRVIRMKSGSAISSEQK